MMYEPSEQTGQHVGLPRYPRRVRLGGIPERQQYYECLQQQTRHGRLR
jgi:hypothetical protein